MNGPSHKKLTVEDRILWGRVARSVILLPGRIPDEPEVQVEDFADMLDTPLPPAVEMPALVQKQMKQFRLQNGIDAPIHTKLAKGRLPIEGKVDLHGLNQSQAYTLLLSFFHRAYADGRRYVLVVTGKGSSPGSDGVLRNAVPAWFATPAFRTMVGGYETASRRHGGAGALYVQLRRLGR